MQMNRFHLFVYKLCGTMQFPRLEWTANDRQDLEVHHPRSNFGRLTSVDLGLKFNLFNCWI